MSHLLWREIFRWPSKGASRLTMYKNRRLGKQHQHYDNITALALRQKSTFGITYGLQPVLKISPDLYDIYLLWKAYKWQVEFKVTVHQAGATSLREPVSRDGLPDWILRSLTSSHQLQLQAHSTLAFPNRSAGGSSGAHTTPPVQFALWRQPWSPQYNYRW